MNQKEKSNQEIDTKQIIYYKNIKIHTKTDFKSINKLKKEIINNYLKRGSEVN